MQSFGQTGDLGEAQGVFEQVGGNVDAVEHVADVVQHAGSDLGHAGLAGGVHQFLVQAG